MQSIYLNPCRLLFCIGMSIYANLSIKIIYRLLGIYYIINPCKIIKIKFNNVCAIKIWSIRKLLTIM